ncbi:MAG: NUDIX domain-containing protein [archaeon]
MSEEEVRPVVDENDNVIGKISAEKSETSGLRHRVSHVWVFNSEGKILLQLRPKHKKVFPNTWTSSVGEHVMLGETYEQAAVRGLKEELGITVKPENIEFLKKFDVEIEGNHEFLSLYKTVFDDEFNPDSIEVQEIKFFSLQELKEVIENNSSSLDGFVKVFLEWFFEKYKLEDLDEILPVVNERDEVIGKIARSVSETSNLRHRSSHVLLFNSEGKLLVQVRALTKELGAGKFGSSAGEHVRLNESYEQAAVRGLEEELGIKSPFPKIVFLKKFDLKFGKNHEFYSLYKTVFDGAINFDKNEVEEVKWFSLEEIKTIILKEPERLGIILKAFLEYYFENH